MSLVSFASFSMSFASVAKATTRPSFDTTACEAPARVVEGSWSPAESMLMIDVVCVCRSLRNTSGTAPFVSTPPPRFVAALMYVTNLPSLEM